MMLDLRSPDVTVAFAVSTLEMDHGSGDLYTARGLGAALERLLGWTVRYLPPDHWSETRDVDVFVAMRDDVDIGKAHEVNPALVSVAWMRNWLELWVERPWFDQVSLQLCSSARGAGYVQSRTGVTPALLPIAVSLEQFRPGPPVEAYACDYVFTGNYWLNAPPRDIERLDPSILPYRFRVFGRKWRKHPSFAPYAGGFVPYDDLARAYNSAPITVDDSVTHTTKLWGSVNSRVFEALAAGSLVVTNNAIGSEELFGGRLPVWSDAAELVRLVRHYLEHPDERLALLSELRREVLTEHSYDRRAQQFVDLLQARAG